MGGVITGRLYKTQIGWGMTFIFLNIDIPPQGYYPTAPFVQILHFYTDKLLKVLVDNNINILQYFNTQVNDVFWLPLKLPLAKNIFCVDLFSPRTQT